MQILTNEQIQRAAPAVFATEPWNEMSKRYAFIPTINVVEAMRKEGFLPVRAQQSLTKTAEKKGYTKHMLRFRRADQIDMGNKENVAEIVLVNSHDGASSYQLSAGIYRKVCSNGLIAYSPSLGQINVRHTGNIIQDVIEGSYRIINDVPAITERIEYMKGISLTPGQQQAYASAALSLRYEEDEETRELACPITTDAILKPRRSFDNQPDVWSTFNRVQENMLQGGVRGMTAKGKRTTTKKIRSVGEDIRLNKALWKLAEEVAKLATK